MNNNVKSIDQRLSQHCALVEKFKYHSTVAENRYPREIIRCEIKRINIIQELEKKLGELRALIPVFKAECPANEHLLAVQIINIDLQIIVVKLNHIHVLSHFSSPPPAAPQLSVLQPPIPQ